MASSSLRVAVANYRETVLNAFQQVKATMVVDRAIVPRQDYGQP